MTDELSLAREVRHKRIARYRNHLATANNEAVRKELFMALLQDLFGNDPQARLILEQMTLGAERAVLNIPLQDRLKTGFADTQYGRVIIEFEANLSKTGRHAKEQLAEYLAGNWKSGDTYRFVLIATDCREWEVVAPHYEQLADPDLKAADLQLDTTDVLTVGEENAEDFYLFLDRHLFGTQPIRPTLERIAHEFGETGAVFITALGVLRRHHADIGDDPAVRVATEQWSRFLAIAYGSFDRDDEKFLVHTYLSVFAKILAYEVLTRDERIDDAEMRGILTGEVFDKLNVRGFVDRDFFAWVAEDRHLTALRPMFREIARAVGRYDFSDVSEDILKGVYQGLIDLDTRHALGEYYTPDWLCERVLAELEPTATMRILDPACGSGSFLRAAVARLRSVDAAADPHDLAEQIVGIDIHPLSVQIAKTTLLLALGPAVRRATRPVPLRVYLANTLRTPEGSVGELFGGSFSVAIDDRSYTLAARIFNHPRLFDAGVSAAEELAEATRGAADVPPETLAAAIARRADMPLPDDELRDDFHKIYRAIKRAKEVGRDGIWKFIVQNLYKPFFLRGQFDLIVGNPPWLTYSDVAVADYQSELAVLAERHGVLPGKANNRTHLEIATIFQAHAAAEFLRQGGRMALVLPRSFFSADHHAETRDGRAKGFKLSALWDLDDVAPLFRVPACVLFAEKAKETSEAAHRRPPKSGLPGATVAGKLRGLNQTWAQASERLTFSPVTWYVGKLGARTAFTTRKPKRAASAGNVYKQQFRQGATIVPRNAYFVTPAQNVPDLHDRELVVETDRAAALLAKPPWKSHFFKGRIHSDFLFRTAQATHLLPFVLRDPPLVLLPAKVVVDAKTDGFDRVALLTPTDLQADGHLETAKWFADVEKVWNAHKTQRGKDMSFLDRLNYSRGITQQSLSERYVVLYNASAKDANAAILDRQALDKPFVVDTVAYWFGTHSAEEADYLTSFLNANEPNRIIKDFQPRGLFGARHVHKTILEVPLPRFDATEPTHAALAALGRSATEKATAWYAGLTTDEQAGRVGMLRRSLRKHLAKELKQIDAALRKLL